MMRGSSPHDDRHRRLRTTNAVWTLGPGQWALGAYKICQQITDTIPEDHEAIWEDADHLRFCIRPQPVTPAMLDESAQVTPRFHTRAVGIYQIGRGVLVKFKHMGEGGSSREPAAMNLIRKEAPSVPVPEVFHHWKDPKWFCYVTIMCEMPGCEIIYVWFALDESQKQRLAEEAADYFRAIGEIQSEIAEYANGDNLCDGLMIRTDYVDEWAEPEQSSLRFNFKQLNEHRQSEGAPPFPEEYGDRFHLCHMDPNPDHVFVSGFVTTPPMDYVHSMPLEEQAKLHISGIIDFERSGFYPKFMVSWQFRGLPTFGLANHKYGLPDAAASEFDNAIIKALIKLGFPDPEPIRVR